MNALRPPSQSSSASPIRRVGDRVRRSSRRSSHQSIAIEATARLGINLVLGIAAISALVKLVPYNMVQEAKLKELQAEVSEVEGRVDRLQAEFNHHFDPKQSISVMQEQSVRMHPNQRKIFWVTPSSSSVAEDPSNPPGQTQHAWSRQQ